MAVAGGYLAYQVQSFKQVAKFISLGGLLAGLATWTAITLSDNQFLYKPVVVPKQEVPSADTHASHTAPPRPTDKVELSTQAVTFSPPTLEFGEVRLGESVTRKVLIANHSTTPLTITAIGVGCHCTTVSLPSKHLAPGATSEMIVNYKAGPETGTFKLSIGLKTEELSQPLMYFLTVTVP